MNSYGRSDNFPLPNSHHWIRALQLGQPVLAAQLLLENEDDPLCRSYLLALRENRSRLALPEGVPELKRIREELRIECGTYTPVQGIYSLSVENFPAGGKRSRPTGLVQLVKPAESGSSGGDEQFLQACRDARHAVSATHYEMCARGQECSLRRIDDSRKELKAGSGHSIGLAYALALVCQGRLDQKTQDNLYVAATGQVNREGKVLPVDEKTLEVKLEGLVREAPYVKIVILPQDNEHCVTANVLGRFEAVHFVDNLEQAIAVLGGKTFISSGCSWRELPKLEWNEERHHEALRKEIGCAGAKKASTTRLVFPLCLELKDLSRLRSLGWLAKSSGEIIDYFSKLGIGESDRFRDQTDDILFWGKDSGSRRPMVFELDKGLFRGRLRLSPGNFTGTLERVDLLPVKRREDALAYLGFVFAGRQASVRDYLGFVSKRTFSNLTLLGAENMHKKELKLGTILAELRESLLMDRPVDFDNPTASRWSSREPKILQYLVVPDSVDWKDVKQDLVWKHAWRLCAGFARPQARPAKELRQKMVYWEVAEQAVDTRFGLHERGLTVWAHGGDEFNRTSKHTLVSKPLYILWVLAREFADKKRDATRLLPLDLPRVRREFFKNCLSYYMRHEYRGGAS